MVRMLEMSISLFSTRLSNVSVFQSLVKFPSSQKKLWSLKQDCRILLKGCMKLLKTRNNKKQKKYTHKKNIISKQQSSNVPKQS